MEQEQEQGSNSVEDYVVGSLPTLIYIPNFITEAEQSELLHHIYEGSPTRWKNLKKRRLQNWGGVVHEKGLLPQELPPWLKKITKRIYEKTSLFPSDINHVLINEYLPDQGIMPHQDGPAYFPVASILSLQSPVVIDFTPHPKWREFGEKERLRSENLSNLEEQISEVVKEDLLNELVCSLKDDQCSLLLMPCSLLLFKDQAYLDFLHGIKDSTVHSLSKVINVSECMKLEDWKECHPTTNGKTQEHCFNRTSTRVSLTCRLVPKVCKNLFKF
ncbi:alpha-ketoglutarate-dependent dioxygenase alkB homolog 6 isoform X2 [Phalaenopsis equestris]|uniref:alpha-ketoglutarate-dependent dioxygenase alkB homolog 6 isoform X2 n=1 Tax=Phalaenopsis equestris TaxID=78828 RepID=UPI0009E2A0F9|nr:alpha-ketoglutarate-dependent dioxygenase alkB homolog 6 isoform X2 [Phalaenopsis equestris]